MLISDWSSDVCSSDLFLPERRGRRLFRKPDQPRSQSQYRGRSSPRERCGAPLTFLPPLGAGLKPLPVRQVGAGLRRPAIRRSAAVVYGIKVRAEGPMMGWEIGRAHV